MIDIHSHILRGVDDGVRTLEESVAILRDAAGAGTTDIVATPHANDEFRFDPHLIGSRIAELRSLAEKLPRIHRGCDFHLSASNIEDALQNPAKYTINGHRYLLVEFPDMFISPATEQILSLLAGRGMTPVITHPERNPVLHRDIARLSRWAAQGYLLQVTALSLLDRFGKAARESAWELIECGAAHIVASDAHHPDDRHARLDEAYRVVTARAGEERAAMLFVVNPGAVVEGREVMSSTPLARPRKWYQLGR
ncbi:MAG: CpsB/CapC family capsule biosynthesis tyrosine phosphatase [Bryobacteraceae bacterium]|jgi:protein-tyrosine phosphatase